MTEGLAASRCEPRREIRGAEDETDVRRSEEQILLKWSYTRMQSSTTISTSSIFFLIWCAACLLLLLISVAFNLRLWCNQSRCCVCLACICWCLVKNRLRIFVRTNHWTRQNGLMRMGVVCLSRMCSSSLPQYDGNLVQLHCLWHVAPWCNPSSTFRLISFVMIKCSI